jgi:Fe2+ transport system protein FeoA
MNDLESNHSDPAGSTSPNHDRLDCLHSGDRAVVREIEGRDSAMLRLMAMGLCVGREIAVLRHGNPLIIQLLGARVGLSGVVAHRIIVERRVS